MTIKHNLSPPIILITVMQKQYHYCYAKKKKKNQSHFHYCNTIMKIILSGQCFVSNKKYIQYVLISVR